MKLLFVHETKIKKDSFGNFYTDGSYKMEVWNRYLDISKNLTVLARIEEKIYDYQVARKKFNVFDNTKIKLIEIPDLFKSVKSFSNIKNHKLKKEIIKQSVLDNDAIIVRLPSHAGNIAIRYAKKFNKKYLVEVVGCPWDSLWNYNIKGKIIAIPSYLSMKAAVKRAPFALYVTNEFLQKRYPNKGKTINCSNVELPPSDRRILEKRLNKINTKDNNMPIVLGTTAAVDVPYKGQEYVIKAISKLRNEGYNFEYHLAGGGDKSYLESVAKKYGVLDKIKFLSALPHDKVFNYLDNIDIYIQPSKQEGLPRALIEAMSRGCPCLGSKTGGIPELLNQKFVFKKGDVRQICKLLKLMDKESMKNEAYFNFEKAKEFEKKLLDERRTKFLNEFARDGEEK